jgi:hypothetical protein
MDFNLATSVMLVEDHVVSIPSAVDTAVAAECYIDKASAESKDRTEAEAKGDISPDLNDRADDNDEAIEVIEEINE